MERRDQPMRDVMKRILLALVAIVVALGVGACGSSDKKSSGSGVTTTTVAPSDVADTAAYDASLSTWATATTTAGLVSKLAGKGPYTVFAPSNDAFAKLTNKRLSALLRPENKKKLAALVSGHVVAKRIAAGDLKAGKLKTLAGTTLTVSESGDGFVVSDGDGQKATIAVPPSTGTNGVVYTINAVLGS
jgi:uncharacterized surface protein with fasciclin (FAS1) repeats